VVKFETRLQPDAAIIAHEQAQLYTQYSEYPTSMFAMPASAHTAHAEPTTEVFGLPLNRWCSWSPLLLQPTERDRTEGTWFAHHPIGGAITVMVPPESLAAESGATAAVKARAAAAAGKITVMDTATVKP
jgi:hypothetical protein